MSRYKKIRPGLQCHTWNNPDVSREQSKISQVIDKAGCSYYSGNPIDSPAPGLKIVSCVGEMSEWSKEAVLKTVEAQVSEGSNPPLSGLDKFFYVGEVREWPNRAPC